MMVRNGDPSPQRWFQNFFDCGEYLLGGFANSLELGCDCVGDITYLDAVLADSAGGVAANSSTRTPEQAPGLPTTTRVKCWWWKLPWTCTPTRSAERLLKKACRKEDMCSTGAER